MSPVWERLGQKVQTSWRGKAERIREGQRKSGALQRLRVRSAVLIFLFYLIGILVAPTIASPVFGLISSNHRDFKR
jgi:positive regulator of sigma E activity